MDAVRAPMLLTQRSCLRALLQHPRHGRLSTTSPTSMGSHWIRTSKGKGNDGEPNGNNKHVKVR
eukprot:3547361-Amphidinium_carterae.1